MTVQVHVSVSKFAAQIDAAIITTELTEFLTQLQRICKTLTGSAEFNTIEEQIELRLTSYGLGQIELRGLVSDGAGGQGNSLRFGLDIDQSYLRRSILELEDVISEFPART